MAPRQKPTIPPFKVWCRTCDGTNVERVDEDNQDDIIVFKYKCRDCSECWTTVYKKQVTKRPADYNYGSR